MSLWFAAGANDLERNKGDKGVQTGAGLSQEAEDVDVSQASATRHSVWHWEQEEVPKAFLRKTCPPAQWQFTITMATPRRYHCFSENF